MGRKSGQKNGLNLNEDLFLFFFFWSSPKSGQTNGLNLSENLFFCLHLFGLHLSHLVFIYLFKFLATRLIPLSKMRTPLEQRSATYILWAVSGPRSQTSIRDPLCDYRKSLATQPNPALKLPQHLTKPFFFLEFSTTNRPKTTLKFEE